MLDDVLLQVLPLLPLIFPSPRILVGLQVAAAVTASNISGFDLQKLLANGKSGLKPCRVNLALAILTVPPMRESDRKKT